MNEQIIISLLTQLNENDYSLEFYTNKNLNDSISLRVKAKETPYRVGYDSTAFILKLTHLKTKDDFIEISKNFETIANNYNINYKKNKDYLRFSTHEFSRLSETDQINFIVNIALSSFSFASFGCCSRFPNCEINGCSHPDKLYAISACTVYKRLFL